MTDDLTETFVNESKENITQLNNSLLDLESDPENEEAIDSIFRQAHTLKGNFGAMGYDQASEVAHAIEDLLDEVRQGNLSVTADRMDLIFEGIDEIENLVEDIQEHGQEQRDSDEIIDRLRGAVEGDTEASSADEAASQSEETASDDVSDAETGEETTEIDGVPVTTSPSADHLKAAMDALSVESEAELPDEIIAATFEIDGGGMKGADASLMLEQLEDETDIVGGTPPIDAIEDGEFEDEVTVYLDGIDLEEAAHTVPDVWAVSEPRLVALALTDDGTQAQADDSGTTGESDTPSSDSTSSATAGDSSGATSADTDTDTDTDTEPDVESIDEVQSVRVDVETLDELHETVEQLVTSRIKLRQAIEDNNLTDASDALDEVDKVSSSLQSTVMDMRLIPLKKVFDKFPRLVRDISRAQDKQVNFEIKGEDIELDRTIIDEIGDPLMHTLRNAVDHGIEPPEERDAAGKDPTGEILLEARREQDTVHISVEDDGRGLDREQLVDKAVNEGVAPREELEQYSDQEVYELIFHPGFSTNEEVTDVSGRGVGMDVVRTTVESLDGSVEIESTPGEGTTITLKLPVSVAIVRVLFVKVSDQLFGLPIKYIDEISSPDGVRTMNGEEAITYEGDIYPLIRLREALEKEPLPGAGDPHKTPDSGMVLRIRESERQVALHCDDVTRQEEVVITPLQGVLRDVEGVSGTSVIGDGHVIPILDPNTLPIPGGEDETLAGSFVN